MDSRIEKYYKQDLSDYKRTKKNAKLYEEIYGNSDDLEDLPLSNNVRELNLSQIKNEIGSREEYQRAKEYGNITNSRVIEKIDEENIQKNASKKIYDINELLERAKNENKKVQSEDNTVDNRYLKSLEKFSSMEGNIIKEKQDDSQKEETFAQKVEENMHKTASLSLDILSDLKPDDNTIVSSPIKEELKNEMSEQEKKDNIFYSGTYSFKKEDFDINNKDDDFSDIQTSGNSLKIALLIIGILICVVVIVLTLKYCNII